MPTTQRGIDYIAANDAPNIWDDMQALADSVEAAMDGQSLTGVPATNVSLTGAAWTPICSVAITMPYDARVDIAPWAKLTSSGAGRPMVALRVLDGATFLFGIGRRQMGGTGDAFGAETAIETPRRSVTLTAGAHTLWLEGYKDANGTVDAIKTETLAAQAIPVTGIEVSYP